MFAPVPIPVNCPLALTAIVLFNTVEGALLASVLIAPIPTGVTVPPPAPLSTPPALMLIPLFNQPGSALMFE